MPERERRRRGIVSIAGRSLPCNLAAGRLLMRTARSGNQSAECCFLEQQQGGEWMVGRHRAIHPWILPGVFSITVCPENSEWPTPPW